MERKVGKEQRTAIEVLQEWTALKFGKTFNLILAFGPCVRDSSEKPGARNERGLAADSPTVSAANRHAQIINAAFIRVKTML